MGMDLHGRPVREYIYACPLGYGSDKWPTSLSIVTGSQLNTVRAHGRRAMPVEVPDRPRRRERLAVCVHAAYGHIDPVRLIEWFEFQRILGVSLVGVYLMSNFSQSAETVFRYRTQLCSHSFVHIP